MMDPHYQDATVALTEAERHALRQYMAWGGDDADLYAAVERIVAARVAAERERANTAEAKLDAVETALIASRRKRSPHGVREMVRSVLNSPRGEA